MTLPLALLIFVPSVSSRSGTSVRRATGSGNRLCPPAYLVLKRRATVRVSSRWEREEQELCVMALTGSRSVTTW
jgi:hypothetical protein